MKSIGICMVVNGNYAEVKACVENIFEKSRNANFHFYILDNATTDTRIQEYFKTLCEGYRKDEPESGSNYFVREDKRIDIHAGYNKLFQAVEEDYVCIFPQDVIVNDLWWADLLEACEAIVSPGVVAIRTGREQVQISSLLSLQDAFMPVWKTNDSTVTGVCLIRTDVLRIIGGYDKALFGTGYEQEELCYRYASNVLNNYYVFEQNCVKINDVETKTVEGLVVYLNAIDEMNKTKIYKKQF